MKRTNWKLAGLVAVLLGTTLAGEAADAKKKEKVTFDDHVFPIMRNRCMKCHNASDLKGGLDLSNFSAALRGGASGEILNSGDPEGSKFFTVTTQAEEPTMPPNSGPIPSDEIEVLRKWIAGGMLETAGSKAIKSNKPKMDLTVAASDIGKPKGPPAMPKDWIQEPYVRTERNNAVLTMASSPWAPLVALGDEKQVLVYNTDTLQLEGVLPFPEGFPKDIKFSRNGKLLLVGGGYGAQLGVAAVYDVVSGERVMRVGDDFDVALAADISADQKYIALGGPTKLVKLYSTATGELVHSMKKHTDWVTAGEFSPDGKLLATGDRAGGVIVWDAASGEDLYVLRGHRGAIKSVSWRADSEILISASEDRSVKMWKVKDEEQVRTWNAHGGGTLYARYAMNGNIVTAGRDRNYTIWNGSAARQRNITAIADLPVSATLSHDGKRLIGGDWAGNVGVWNAADGKLVGKLDPNPPSLDMRLADAAKELAAKEGAAKAAGDAVAKAEAAAKSAKAEVDKHWAASQVGKVASLAKQAESLSKQIAAASGAELARLKANADKATAGQKAAEKAVVDLKAQLAKTDPVSSSYKSVQSKLAAAQKQAAASAKAMDEALKALSDQSVKALAAAEAEAKKVKDAIAKTDKTSAKFKELVTQLVAANQKVAAATQAEAARLQALTDKSVKELAAAEADVAKLSEQLKKTDKTNKAYADLQKKIADAGKRAAEAKKATGAATGLVAALKASGDKANASLAAGQTEAAKLLEALKKTDPAYLAHVAAGKKLDAANKSLAEARAKAGKADAESLLAQKAVDQWKVARFNVELHAAKKELESRQNELAVQQAEAREAEGEVVAVKQKIKALENRKAEMPSKLAGLKNVAKFDLEFLNEAKAEWAKATDAKLKADTAVKNAVAAAEKAKSDAVVAQNNLAKVEELRKQIAAAKKAAGEKNAEAKKATDGQAASAKALAKAETAVKAAEAAVKQSQTDAEKAKAAAEAAKDNKELAAKAKASAAEVAKRADALKKEQAALASLKGKHAEITKSAAATDAAAGKAIAALKALEGKYAASQGDKAAVLLKTAEAAAEKAAAAAETAKKNAEAAGKAVAERKAAVDAESKNYEATKNELVALEAEAAKLPAAAKELAAQLKQAEAALGDATKAVAVAEKAAAEQDGKVKQMSATYAKMKGEAPVQKQAKL